MKEYKEGYRYEKNMGLKALYWPIKRGGFSLYEMYKEIDHVQVLDCDYKTHKTLHVMQTKHHLYHEKIK